MEEWEAVIQEWYPKALSRRNYPLKVSKQYTSSQRWEIYERLTKAQRALVDKHRRYLINSRFLEEHYLAATDWSFSDFRINPFYHTERRQEKLYCACGRELKVQYTVKSEKTGQVLHLGITHFVEHLHVSPTVATSIQQGMTKVDLALDELLWLKQQNISFPEALWQEYLLALYHNRRLKQSVRIDTRLAVRVAEFRRAEMPIYLADYQQLKAEIEKIGRQATEEPSKKAPKKENVASFTEELSEDIESFLTNYQLFLQNDLAKVAKVGQQVNTLPAAFFEELIQWLRASKRSNTSETWAAFQKSIDSSAGRFIQTERFYTLFDRYCRYGFTENFFYGIPRPLKNGLLRALKKETAERTGVKHNETNRKRSDGDKIQTSHSVQKIVDEKLWSSLIQDSAFLTERKMGKLTEKGYRLSSAQKEALSLYQDYQQLIAKKNPESLRLFKQLMTE